jgi:chaperone modulatory protein CbpM
MAKHLMVVTVEEHPEFSLEEVCRASGVTPDFVLEMIEYGALEPKGHSHDTLRFDERHLSRILKVMHLYHDLEVNMPGAAIILDLVDERDRLRIQIELLQKYLNR